MWLLCSLHESLSEALLPPGSMQSEGPDYIEAVSEKEGPSPHPGKLQIKPLI